MAKARVTPRAGGSMGRGPAGRGASSFLTDVPAGQRLSGAGLEPGYLRDAGNGLLGDRGMREAGPGLLRSRGVTLPAGGDQRVQRDTACVLHESGEGGHGRRRGDLGLDHRAGRVVPGGGEGYLAGGDRAGILALAQRTRGGGIDGHGGGGAVADQLGDGYPGLELLDDQPRGARAQHRPGRAVPGTGDGGLVFAERGLRRRPAASAGPLGTRRT